MRLFALFRLAFATATPVYGLTLPHPVTRRLIKQKARGRPQWIAPLTWLPLLVDTRFQVLFHSPHRGSFHLSLTVLVHYRSQAIFSLARWSSQLPTGLHVSRGTQELLPGRTSDLTYGTITLYGGPFQGPSTIAYLDNFPGKP